MMKRLLLLTVAIVAVTSAFSQQKNFWTKTSEPPTNKQLQAVRTKASAFETFALDLPGMKQHLRQAPIRGVQTRADLEMSFPTPDGKLQRFRVIEASVLHPDLAARYPGIKSYA